jgi:hypothetical protein
MNDLDPSAQNGEEPNRGLAPAKIAENGSAKPSGFEKSTLRWARLAVVMSGVAALFVCAQWKVMRDQLNEMRGSGNQTERLIILNQGQLSQNSKLAEAAGKQASDTHDLAVAAGKQSDNTATIAGQAVIQAKATNKLARQAERSANIAQKAADTSLEALQATQKWSELSVRPYVWMRQVTLRNPLKVGEPIRVAGELRNSGRTPAVYLEIKNDFFFTASPANVLVGIPPYAPYNAPSPARLIRMQDVPAEDKRNFEMWRDNLTQEEFDGIAQGNKAIFFYGCVHYHSVDGTQYEWPICFYRDRNTQGNLFLMCNPGYPANANTSQEQRCR